MSNPMNLTIPDPNATIGPTYAADVSDALTTIASHRHITGEGDPVPTAGLDIDADLTFGGFNATHLKSTQFTSQDSPLSSSFLSCLYVSGGELYYNDGNGTSIKFTDGGVFNASLVGAFTNLAGTTGAATYDSVSGTFTFTSNTNVKATLSIGPLKIADTAANALPITIKSPTGVVSSYTLTLPGALPAANALVQVGSTGTMTFGPAAPASQARLMMSTAGAVTAQAAGQQVSVSSGSFATTSTTFVTVTGAGPTDVAVTLTTTGRPVIVGTCNDGTATDPSNFSIRATNGAGTFNGTIDLQVAVSGSATATIGYTTLGVSTGLAVADISFLTFSPSSVFALYAPAAGTYTFTLQMKVPTGYNGNANNLTLFAYEI